MNSGLSTQHSALRGKRRTRRLLVLAAVAASALFLAGTAPAATLTWNVAGDGTWDTTSDNWTGDATKFTSDGTQDVFFTEATAGHTITLSPGMSPASTTVSGDYTFNGEPVATGSLTKSGGGTLNLQVSPANFSSIAVNSGTLYVAGYLIGPDGASFNMGTGVTTVGSGATLMGERAVMAGSLVVHSL